MCMFFFTHFIFLVHLQYFFFINLFNFQIFISIPTHKDCNSLIGMGLSGTISLTIYSFFLLSISFREKKFFFFGDGEKFSSNMLR